MLKPKPFTFGKIKGTIYDFEKINDELPSHWHTEDNYHITIIARGSFTASGLNWSKTLNPGDIIDFAAYQYHQFIALEPNSRLINVQKGEGEPMNMFGDIPK